MSCHGVDGLMIHDAWFAGRVFRLIALDISMSSSLSCLWLWLCLVLVVVLVLVLFLVVVVVVVVLVVLVVFNLMFWCCLRLYLGWCLRYCLRCASA